MGSSCPTVHGSRIKECAFEKWSEYLWRGRIQRRYK
jgi:hypothetical protein